jgi:hypothetical protein
MARESFAIIQTSHEKLSLQVVEHVSSSFRSQSVERQPNVCADECQTAIRAGGSKYISLDKTLSS